jgi:hypothetical protein
VQVRANLVIALVIATVASACGASRHGSAPATTARPTTVRGATTARPPAALQGEPASAAAGDIPDNQVFLVFRNERAGYTMKYPEGWAQQGSGNVVVFRDKNNIVRVDVAAGTRPSAASVRADLQRLRGARVTRAPQAMSLSGNPGFKIVYQTRSAPNPVTGKRVTLIVDRYYVWAAGRRAIVDLGTPQGVDNVDAYRLMIESFRWR